MLYKTIYTLLIILVLCLSSNAQSIIYYIDDIYGNDSNNGTSISTAWKSLEKVNSNTFQPGDIIFFKCNGIWDGKLYPKGSGTINNPITIGKYGNGSLPLLNGNGVVTEVVYLYNQEYWILKDLEITNNSGVADNVKRRAVYIQANNFGTVSGIQLLNLNIHDVNSFYNSSDETTKNYGGIIIETTGSSVPTKYDNLLIEGCTISNCDRTGIATISSWDQRSLTTNTNWTPNTNLIVRNNWIERVGANGLIIRVSDHPIIERNVFKLCSLKWSGNAMFVFNCDDAIIQYNESFLTVYNPGDNDASGFDADYRCKRTIIQYNYSHDNDDGFVVVTCQGGSDRFNDETIVRYNISQNDGGNGSTSGGIIYLSGTPTNTYIYNNVIYSSSTNSIRRIVYHNSWSGYPDRTYYYNNIFYILKTPFSTAYSLSSSTNNTFDYNLYFGQSSTPFDPHKILSDPKFLQPASAYEGINSVFGYQLLPTSPCIDAGINLVNNGGKDFWGNSIPGNSKTDIGFHEFNGTPTRVKEKLLRSDFKLFQNYPNPFNPETIISYNLPYSGFVNAVIYNSIGQVVHIIKKEVQSAGYHEIKWNSLTSNNSSAVSGIYFCSVQFESNIRIVKMLFLK